MSTVKVGPNPVTIAAGKTTQLTGGAYNAAGNLIPNAGAWVTNNASVATVNTTGLVTGVGAGTTNIEFVYKTRNAWSTVTVTGVAPPPPPTSSTTVAPADSFSRSVGVSIHFSYFDLTPYQPGANVTRTTAQVKALGVAFIRDGVPYNTDANWNNIAYAPLKTLSTQGVRVLMVMQPAVQGQWSSTQQIDTAVKRLGASGLLGFEGPNEVDNNNGWWGGIPAYGAATKTFQCAAYARVKALAPGALVISPTVTSTTGASNMPDLSACADGATIHPYPGGGLPIAALAQFKSFTSTFVKNKPFWITEFGYHTNVNGTVNHWQPGVSEAAAAKYITREYLDAFRSGVVHSSTYEFVDGWNDATNDEANFGLVRNDGTLKPSYGALQRLLAAVSDPGPAFALPAFTYTISGASNATRTLALVKRSGVVDLVMWNDVLVYDVSAKKDIVNAPTTVTVTLTAQPSKITALYPVVGSAVSQIASAKTFPVTVQDAPVVVELTP